MRRKKPLFVTAFLLMLFIVPMIFTLSYGGVAIPTEPNMNKDFSISSDNWLDGWDYRREVSITGATSAGTNYQVEINITYNSTMETDFDDIRFTDNDGITLLDYWLENKTDSSGARFWVEVKDDLGTAKSIYLYYGNSTVNSTSNGPCTFPFFDDFNDASLNATLWYNWLTGGTTTESGGQLTVTGGAAATETQGGKIKFGESYAFEYNVSFDTEQDIVAIGFDDRSDDGNVEGASIDSCEIIYDSGLYYRTKREGLQSNIASTTNYEDWTRLSIRREEFGETEVSLNIIYEDRSLTESLSANISTDNCGVWVYARNTDSVVNLDFVFVRNYVYTEPTVSSFGDVESLPDWQNAGTAIIIFEVPVFTGSLDALLIFLGLIMIPASTLYFVKGGKEEMSSNKVYYCLIAFCIGWALFLGGIYG